MFPGSPKLLNDFVASTGIVEEVAEWARLKQQSELSQKAPRQQRLRCACNSGFYFEFFDLNFMDFRQIAFGETDLFACVERWSADHGPYVIFVFLLLSQHKPWQGVNRIIRKCRVLSSNKRHSGNKETVLR